MKFINIILELIKYILILLFIKEFNKMDIFDKFHFALITYLILIFIIITNKQYNLNNKIIIKISSINIKLMINEPIIYYFSNKPYKYI